MIKMITLLNYRMKLLILSVIIPLGISAQNIPLHGIVKDMTGEFVIGATVTQRGTNNATVTDLNGSFTINAPSGSTLLISYIGFKTEEVMIKGQTLLNIVLKEDDKTLAEVVVVGYGTMKKSDLTGAVGSLAAKDMDHTPVANIGQAVEGKIAGLQVVDAGKPGDNVTLKVRGLGSINN